MSHERTWRSRGELGSHQARDLRKAMSESEQKLWREIRRDQLGVRVRRQHPVGPYVLDFFVPAASLCIEVDGEQHDPVRDARRDAHLASLGIATIRIPSLELYDDERRAGWIELIQQEIEVRRRLPTPPHSHEGDLRDDEGGCAEGE